MFSRLANRSMRYSLVLILILACAWATQAQDEQSITYRFIRLSNVNSATEIRWISLWERENPISGERELVSLDARGDETQGIQDTCIYLRLTPSEVPVYVVNGQRTPIPNGEQVWANIPSRRILDDYANFARNLDCTPQVSSTPAGLTANQCAFEGVDAPPVFLLRTPITASGIRWTDTENDNLMRYDFSFTSADQLAQARYETTLATLPALVSQPTRGPQMDCFAEGFPLPNQTYQVINNSTYALFDTDQDFAQINAYYQGEDVLPGDWRYVSTTGIDSILLSQAGNNACQATLTYQPPVGVAPASLAVVIVPDYAQAQALYREEDGVETEVFAQSATNATVTEFGTVAESLAKYRDRYLAQGWLLDDALTEERDDSAFVTLKRDNYQLHIIARAGIGRTFIRFQTRTASCGPVASQP